MLQPQRYCNHCHILIALAYLGKRIMIETKNLSKHYGQFEAVKNLTFSLNQGEIVGLLGPNGAGKTTTMRMLTTFLAPSAGSAVVAGFDICKQPDLVRKNIGYLPETPPLYLELRVKEYLSFVAKLKGVSGPEVSKSVDEVIERCFLNDVTNKLCGHLSKGYRQRVGLAQAIVHKPAVIILDEPTSGLDPAQIIEIRKLIRELGEDHTVILSTHILPEVSETCSSVIIIANGEVASSGTIEELTQDGTLEEKFLSAIITRKKKISK